MNKVQVSMQLIRKRIQHGDHALEGFPSERDLAEETGLSRVTIRAALHEAKLEIGRDVSVCTVNDEGMAPYLLKTLPPWNPRPVPGICAPWWSGCCPRKSGKDPC